jgi:tetratricopeptide (TPR) repeat protein
MTRLLVFAAVMLLGMAETLAAGSVRADDLASAESHFERGVALYQEHAYDAALAEFQRAYEMAPRYEVLFNIAQVHYLLHEYAEALAAFERYLDEGAHELAQERRTYVMREIAALRERVGTLAVSTDVMGATVLLDDQELGTTPLAPLVVNLGRHVLRVEHEGHRTITRRLNIASGQTERVALRLEPVTTPGDGSPVEVNAVRGRRALLWTLGGGSLALAAGAGTGFALAYRGNRDLDANLKHVPADAGAIAADRQEVRRAALASDVLGIAAGVTALGCVITWAVTRKPGGRETRLTVGASTLGVRGSF